MAPASAVHLFRLNLLPAGSGRRFHAFLEGHDDEAFYRHHISTVAPAADLKTYRCGNKTSVFEAFARVERNADGSNITLFFVDKDLSDVFAEHIGLDDRVFQTSTYSIENYIATRDTLERIWSELVRINKVTFDPQAVLSHFDSAASAFYRKTFALMLWIVAVRMNGGRVNLANVQLGRLFSFDASLKPVRRNAKDRLVRILERWTGARTPSLKLRVWTEMARRLQKMQPKSLVRGKFDAWFFVEFLNRAVKAAHTEAEAEGGSVTMKTLVHVDNFVEVAASRSRTPDELRAFVQKHFTSSHPENAPKEAADSVPEEAAKRV